MLANHAAVIMIIVVHHTLEVERADGGEIAGK
jgi:hypothetical protein